LRRSIAGFSHRVHPRVDSDRFLGGHFKTGHLWTGQNRPFRIAAETR
jgi:hypothetical protein